MKKTPIKNQINTPEIPLAKGGGLVKGIEENHHIDAFTGNGSFSHTIPLPKARALTPSLGVSYSSHAGNGLLGMGIDLHQDAISIKTSRALPKYDGTDVFEMNGQELVLLDNKTNENDKIKVYVERHQSTFERIEQVQEAGENYWKITHNDNSVSCYGKESTSRIESSDGCRVFKWLLTTVKDALGNKINYTYKKEGTNAYLTKIEYGNYFNQSNKEEFAFTAFIDYGQHTITFDETNKKLVVSKSNTDLPKRQDKLSDYRSGFLVETVYKIHHVLIQHNFKGDEEHPEPFYTHLTKFKYQDKTREGLSLLNSITEYGLKSKSSSSTTDYTYKALPSITLSFSSFDLPTIIKDWEGLKMLNDDKIKKSTIIESAIQLTDYQEDGANGNLYRHGGALYYDRFLGDGIFQKQAENTVVTEAPQVYYDPHIPVNLVSIEGNGQLQLVENNQQCSGYYDRSTPNTWTNFKPFKYDALNDMPQSVEHIDLSGDSITDELLITPDKLYYRPSLGKKGMNEELIILENTTQVESSNGYTDPYVYYGFTNFFGDGLAHRIKIEDEKVTVWPNLGYGKFGKPKVITLPNSNITAEKINLQKQLLLTDVSGNGTTDIVLVRQDKLQIYFNHNGSAFSEKKELLFGGELSYSDADHIQFTDVVGNGNTCLIFSKMTPHTIGNEYRNSAHYYYEFNSNKGLCNKPFLLQEIDNNMGTKTYFTYKSSLKYYLKSIEDKKPWITKLPFHQIVVDTVTVEDYISKTHYTSKYDYANGYFDPYEHQFAGFGYVSHQDSYVSDEGKSNSETDKSTPNSLLTKQWFHLGNGTDIDKTKAQFFKGDTNAPDLPFHCLPKEINQEQEVLFTLVGSEIHHEVWEVNEDIDCPYNMGSACFTVVCDQQPKQNRKSVFRLYQNESIELDYEQRKDDPKVHHHFSLEVNKWNQVLKSATVAYSRRKAIIPEQQSCFIEGAEVQVKNQTKTDARHIGLPLEEKSYEIKVAQVPSATYYTYGEFYDQVLDKSKHWKNKLPYSSKSKPKEVSCRLLSWNTHSYWNAPNQNEIWKTIDDLPSILLPHHTESLVFDDRNVADILGEQVKQEELITAGYVKKEAYWWARSGIAHFLKEKNSFYLLDKVSYDWALEKTVADYLYTESSVTYDDYQLFPKISSSRLSAEIALETHAEIDYRTLSPVRLHDANGNISEVYTDELGIVIATAHYSTDGNEGDCPLSQFKTPIKIDLEEMLVTNPQKYLQGAASFHYYEFAKCDSNTKEWTPAFTAGLARTVYRSKKVTDIQRTVAYNDGFGRAIESKHYAGKGTMTFSKEIENNRWLASGRIRYNAKGEVFQSYLEYFSTTWQHENNWEASIKGKLPPPSVFYYDALGRKHKMVNPQQCFTQNLILNAWESQHFDESDTLLESEYYKNGTWNNTPQEKDAVEKALKFYNTPQTLVIDALDRHILAVSNNKLNEQGEGAPPINWKKTKLTKEDINPQNASLLVSWQSFDIQGRVLEQADARFYEKNTKDKATLCNFIHQYPISGGMSHTVSSDAGTTLGYQDVHGNTRITWDALGVKHSITYDNLQRPLTHYTTVSDDDNTQVTSVTIYGEEISNDLPNMQGKVWKQYDNAGCSLTSGYTFDGHPIKQEFQYRKEYKKEVNWNRTNIDAAENLLEKEVFATQKIMDAIGRPVKEVLPDKTTNTWQYGYMGNCIASTTDVQGLGKPKAIVTNSHLNAHGQLTKVELANDVRSLHQYDPLTQQLIQIKTMGKDANNPLQDLAYQHDPTGLITTMSNQLQAIVYHDNKAVNPNTNYTYDALYRLLEATGKELKSKSIPTKNSQVKTAVHLRNHVSSNLQASANYTEHYAYDKSNNLLQLKHIGSNPYTRSFSIANDSNRVTSYKQGDQSYGIDYNQAGYMLQTGSKSTTKLEWNTQGNIASAIMIDRSKQGEHNDIEYYVYRAGIRVRKITERLVNGRLQKEDKRYLGAYRRVDKSQRTQLHHITLGGVQKHDCVIQYTTGGKTESDYTAENPLLRYQHGNHLNSIGMETNNTGEIISYEEYSPYGATTYSYNPKKLGCTKEYRYSAQEKDSSTGLYYYGYRYYAPWLCRWTRPDPAGIIDGFNLYAFVGNEPIGRVDLMGLGKKPMTRKRHHRDYLGITKQKKLNKDHLKKVKKAAKIKKKKAAKIKKKKQAAKRITIDKRISPKFDTEAAIINTKARDLSKNLTPQNSLGNIEKRQKSYRTKLSSVKNKKTIKKNKDQTVSNIFDVCHRIPDAQVSKSLLSGNRKEITDVFNFHFMEKNKKTKITKKEIDGLLKLNQDFKKTDIGKRNDLISKNEEYLSVTLKLRGVMSNAENVFIGDTSTNRSIQNTGLDLRFSESGSKRSYTPKSKKALELNETHGWKLKYDKSSYSAPIKNSASLSKYRSL